ncbi:ABC transporter permease subunit [Marinobacterium arenosum]|uniref:ABC transporter permease subunit n=1 Tax=Marinobacterium arenosum TaxID=2862496 RepID=UPI001C976339|nr:ABC transporter permease subunit [Marinobacterium arenosum]MBY4677834.1 ABC transporter permease subunit [Marinobacterium arenosum]
MQRAGIAALLFSVLVTVLAFQGLIGFGHGGADWSLLSDRYYQSVLLFSLKQASLSALLSLLLAWPLARALYYRPQLPARRGFLSLCVLAFVMPTLVLITGLVALLGRNGLLSPLLGEQWNLYGLNGILIAHVYLNLPFAVRVMLQQLQHIPDSSWQLAAQLKLSRWQRLRLIEWPTLKPAVLVLFGFVFVLCFNSFAVVLALGGGPRATTLEVAIYQALKYDFNIPEALTLAWSQLLIAGSLFLLLSRWGRSHWLSVDTLQRQWIPQPNQPMKLIHAMVYAAGWLLLLLPIVALLPGVLEVDMARFGWSALLRPTLVSLVVGLLAAGGAMLLAYLMLTPVRQAHLKRQRKRALLLEWLSTHALVAPAMVVSVGLYILLLRQIDLDRWGMLFVVLLNMLMVVPFAVQQLRPRLLQYDAQYHRLCRALKLSGRQRLRLEWPFLRPAFIASFALILVLAIGDLAIFAIFGNEQWTTLPWLIYSYAGSYRIAEASLASLLLLLLCALIVWAFERIRLDA